MTDWKHDGVRVIPAASLDERPEDIPLLAEHFLTRLAPRYGREKASFSPEALEALFEKKIEGFGETFRWISFQKIGTSTMQSRATAGVANATYIFALPGSTGACKDGWDDILHYQLDIRFRPCNFAELMPRLNEGKMPRSG